MSEVAMTANQHAVSSRQSSKTWSPSFSQNMIGSIWKFGIAVVLVCVWQWRVAIPDADARREAERATASAVIETTVTQRLIVEQLRRAEDADIKRDAVMQGLMSASQENTRILTQIMLDQKRGVWKEAP